MKRTTASSSPRPARSRCCGTATWWCGISLAILEYLADKVGRDRFWPKDDAARGMARAMVAEMHSSYLALRRLCPMNIRKRVDGLELTDEARADIVRILGLWAEARARFGKGGPFLFGTFSAADIFYAPVVTRFITYGIGVPGFAAGLHAGDLGARLDAANGSSAPRTSNG